MSSTATLDRMFHALADPTRRAVVERLGTGPASTSELAAPFSMALPSFTQHLGVLEESGLVTSEKQGRKRMYRLTENGFEPAQTWLDRQREQWEQRLDRLDAHLRRMQQERNA